MNIEPLMVIMSPRDFPIFWYWIDKIDFLDKLIIKYHLHHEAHRIALEFFKKHKEYTHFLISTDDVLYTPCHVRRLIRDAVEHDFKVISAYTNWSFKRRWVNITTKDLRYLERKKAFITARDYEFLTLDNVITHNLENPFMQVHFVGLPLTLIKREVLEICPFKPFKWIYDRALGVFVKRGIMFDLEFSNCCKRNNIPIYVDLRLLLMHFGDTRRHINLKGKRKEVKFIPKKRSLKL